MTQSGFLVGTPGYMAPEQAGGKRALVGPATDIYALGVVLYQLLTGQLPFQRDSTLELLRAVTSDEPPRPRRLQPRLPRDLEAITLHCLEKEPGRRYPTAPGAGRGPAALPGGEASDGAARGGGRAADPRLPAPAAGHDVARCSSTISLIGGASGMAWKWLEANDQRDLANAEARQAEKTPRSRLPLPGLPGVPGRRQLRRCRTTTWPTPTAFSN